MFGTMLITMAAILALVIPAHGAHKDLTWGDVLTDCVTNQAIGADEIGGTHILYREASAPDVPASWTQVDAGRVNAYTVTGLADNTEYVFKLRNYAVGGQYCEGLFSSEVTGMSITAMPAPPGGVAFQ